MENFRQFNCKPTSPNGLERSQTGRLEQDEGLIATNFCVTCTQSNRAVAFVPCAHYVTCLPCGHGMTECPVCQSQIMACVRIYE